MASSDLFIIPHAQAWTSAGAVAVGYKLRFYVSGGAYSTAKAVYGESTLTTPLSNAELVADAAGRFPKIYYGSGDYGVQLLTDADVVIWSADPVSKASTSAATTTVAGIVELATLAESLLGTSTTLVPPVSSITEMIQSGFFSYGGTAGGTANALTGTPAPLPTALAAGMKAVIKAASNNTSTTTLNWATLGVIAVKVNGGAGVVACAGGEIMAANTYEFTYSAADSCWILEGEFAERMSPQTVDDTALSLTLAHAGRTLYHSSATLRTWTIPANASVAFPIGTVIKIVNGPAAGVITLAITTDTLQRLDGVAGTGSRTIGASSAVYIEKLSATVWGIGGVFT